MNDFLQALGFLTRIPVSGRYNPEHTLSGSGVAWFGVVGAAIGCILILAAWILLCLLNIPSLTTAAIVVGLWAVVTGALHLDGLADCGDAWMGGLDRSRVLEIMKDTTSGAGAVVAVVIVLAIKISALSVLLGNGDVLALLFASVMARIGLIVAIVKFPYVRSGGLGDALNQTLDLRSVLLVSGLLLLILAVISAPGLVLSAIGAAAGFACVYVWLVDKVNGFTGDIYGALVETGEAAILIALATRI